MLRLSNLFLLILLFCLYSCQTYLPPNYPLAGLFPTVDISQRLEDMQSCQVSEEFLKACLDDMALWQILQDAGTNYNALSLLKRGLAERGYAELDARRVKTKIKWITFSCKTDSNILEINAAFDKKPPSYTRKNIDLKKAAQETKTQFVMRNNLPERQIQQIWYKDNSQMGDFYITYIKQQNPYWKITQKIKLPKTEN
mgnify:CR=1 FL=1